MFKKSMTKRVLKKLAKSEIGRTYREVTKDLSKRVRQMKMPIKLTVTTR